MWLKNSSLKHLTDGAARKVSTTIGPAAGVLVMVVSLKILEKKFDTRGVNNGILSGLVAITACAPLINPEGAFVIGVVSAGVYYTSAALLIRLQIDDVVDAVSGRLASCNQTGEGRRW